MNIVGRSAISYIIIPYTLLVIIMTMSSTEGTEVFSVTFKHSRALNIIAQRF